MANPFDRFDQPAGTGNPFDQFDGKPARSADYEAGRNLPESLRRDFSALQGLSLGFGDEIGGLGGAIAGGIGNLFGKDDGTTFAERYRRTRDAIRGGQDRYMEENPYKGTAARLATGLPLIAVGGPAPAALGVARAAPVGVLGTSLQAGRVGAGFGAVQGAGESTAEDLGGIASDALKGGAESALIGGGANAVLAGAGGVVNTVRRGLSKTAAQDFARLKAAEALARDAKEVPGAVRATAIEDAQTALRDLGPEARVADAAGESTRALLDTMATLPGRSKTLVEEAIRARQAGRGGRIVGAADDALSTGGRRFVAEADDLAAAKARESAPLYAQVRDVPVKLTDDVRGVLSEVDPAAWKRARKIWRGERRQELDVNGILSGKVDEVPLGLLDTLKRGISDEAMMETPEVRRVYEATRKSLISRLDDISPKDAAGKSIYQSARETFGGFANLEELLQAGRKAMTDDVIDIASTVRGLDESQLHAFRVGVLQGLKQKSGRQSGQTELLKFDIEPATQERLRVIFGDEAAYRQFADNLLREGKLKRLESVGRGSQTAARQQAISDLDLNPADVAAPTTGVVRAGMNALARLYGRARTPEATRDEIGRILLAQGKQGEAELNALRAYLNRVNDARAKRAAAAGAFAGINF